MWRVGAVALTLCAGPALAETITAASFSQPTTRYDHGVLGDAVEWGALELTVAPGSRSGPARILTFNLPPDRVFEDVAPRLVDVTGDENPEVIVVEADIRLGAALAIYGVDGKITQTPHIGRTHRWLAPVGAADLDGDGAIEIAYVDRPHLAKTLRVWRFSDGRLTEAASAAGHTNHKIGWDFIAGGLRHCGGPPELVTASQDWSDILATRFDGRRLTSRVIGPYSGPHSLDAALSC